MEKHLSETEIVTCSKGHEFELGEYEVGTLCPTCHPRRKDKLLDKAFRTKKIFTTLTLCKLTFKQEEIIESLENYFIQKGTLTPAQLNLLEDIYEKAST